MEIVLTKDYEQLGKAMDVINVKDGYARNFLIPTGIAVPATEGNRKKVAEAKRITEVRVPCTIPVKVGEEDKIFGSVTAQDIADFLKKEGLDLGKHDVDLEEPIKQLGVYSVRIRLYKDVDAKLKVWVVKEEQA
jgi:large subunit ribosomal protein L9